MLSSRWRNNSTVDLSAQCRSSMTTTSGETFGDDSSLCVAPDKRLAHRRSQTRGKRWGRREELLGFLDDVGAVVRTRDLERRLQQGGRALGITTAQQQSRPPNAVARQEE